MYFSIISFLFPIFATDFRGRVSRWKWSIELEIDLVLIEGLKGRRRKLDSSVSPRAIPASFFVLLSFFLNPSITLSPAGVPPPSRPYLFLWRTIAVSLSGPLYIARDTLINSRGSLETRRSDRGLPWQFHFLLFRVDLALLLFRYRKSWNE